MHKIPFFYWPSFEVVEILDVSVFYQIWHLLILQKVIVTSQYVYISEYLLWISDQRGWKRG